MRHIKLSSVGVSLMVILPLLWIGVTCHRIYEPGYTITVASSVSVQEGLCVSIPCTFTARGNSTFTGSTGYWIRTGSDPRYIVASNDKSNPGRKPNFHLTGNPDTGDCSLTITDTRRGDALFTYYFRFENGAIKYGYNREVTTSLTVTDLVDEPVISDLGTVIAGVEKTLTCSPPRNCPATSLTFHWKKSNVPGIWRENSSTITFTPSLDDDKTTITCEMSKYSWRTTKTSIPLVVYSPPVITITLQITGKRNKKKIIKLDPIRVDEGESLTLKCSVESDLKLNVTWTDGKNNVLQHGIVKELELRLDNITINQTDVYTCSALTDYVINTTSISVIVPYPPRNMEISISSKDLPASHHVNISEAETLTLGCRAEGNPLVNVIWVKGETDVEAPKASNIGSPAMINVTFSEADVYRCFAWNVNGFKEKRIHVDKIKDDPVEIAEQTASGFTISSLNVLIGFICGIAIAVLFILLYKLIARKKNSKKKEYMKAVEPSANGDPTADDIYMNVSEPEHKDEEATDSNGQLDANGVAPDQEEELHYSTIAFTAKPNKVPSSQPESDYAQIQKQ